MLGDHLCEPCRAHFGQLTDLLGTFGIEFTRAPRLVRGLDYYTRTVFEFVDEELDAAQSTICAGGRYDGLVEELGGKATAACGWAAGVERIALSCEQRSESGVADAPDVAGVDVFFAFAEGAARDELLGLLNELRRAWTCETDYARRSLKGQLTHASRVGARIVVAAGPDDIVVRARGSDDRAVPDARALATTLEEMLT